MSNFYFVIKLGQQLSNDAEKAVLENSTGLQDRLHLALRAEAQAADYQSEEGHLRLLEQCCADVPQARESRAAGFSLAWRRLLVPHQWRVKHSAEPGEEPPRWQVTQYQAHGTDGRQPELTLSRAYQSRKCHEDQGQVQQ